MIILPRSLSLLFILLMALAAPAQQHGGSAAASQQAPAAEGAHGAQQGEHEKPFVLFGKWPIPAPVIEAFRWLNFLVLFGLLGYLLRRPMKDFLAAQARAIREGLEGGRRAGQEAAQRLREIEERLARLEAEIGSLRSTAAAEAAAESERLRQASRAETEKILAAAEQDIRSLIKAARGELKAYAAGLAVELAEQRIRTRLTPQSQAALVRAYAEDLRNNSKA